MKSTSIVYMVFTNNKFKKDMNINTQIYGKHFMYGLGQQQIQKDMK